MLLADSGQSQSFTMRRSLNSSLETNEDGFGGRMYFCIEGVLGPICSSVTPTRSSVLFLFGLSLAFPFNSFFAHVVLLANLPVSNMCEMW